MGLGDPRILDHVYRLKKTLYDLCHAHLVWFQRFNLFFLVLGSTRGVQIVIPLS